MSLHGKHRVRIGDTEIETEDWTLTWADGPYIVGLTDTHGSFSGTIEDDSLVDLNDNVEVYLYGPALLPWYRAWWIRFRGKEWPDAVYAHGPAYVSYNITRAPGADEIRIIGGKFNQSGKWTINEAHDRTWRGKWDDLRMRFWNWRDR
jgi:hypothetical protein